jgi:hypothetical protein
MYTLGINNSGSNKALQLMLKSKELNGPNGLVFDNG